MAVEVAPGTVLQGRYRLIELLGAGGLGDVWLARDLHVERSVAVKLFPSPPPDDPFFLKRMRLDWARFYVHIDHPDVVRLHDLDIVPDGGLFVVMEFVPGCETLTQLLDREGRMAPARVMSIVAHTAEAIGAVHRLGGVHRELWPGSVLVRPDGTTRLALFGPAFSYGQTWKFDKLTVGRVRYFPPERALGEADTQLSDGYVLGVIAFRCLAGYPPFDSENPLELAMRIVRETPAHLPANIPQAVRSFVERAIAREPARRWPTMTALGQAAARLAR